jgi:hypothetical protein
MVCSGNIPGRERKRKKQKEKRFIIFSPLLLSILFCLSVYLSLECLDFVKLYWPKKTLCLSLRRE